MSDALRIVGGAERGEVIRFTVDGRSVTARAGETVAAALLAAGQRQLRTSPRRGEARGALCFMGICQECLVIADGMPVQACLEAAREGMVVRTGGVRIT